MRGYLSTFGVDFIDRLDGVEVIDTRVKADFVHNNDTGFTSSSIEFTHRRRHITRRDNVSLALDSGFDDGGVVGVRNEGNNKIMSGNLLL
jgi:hypothetical protein